MISHGSFEFGLDAVIDMTKAAAELGLLMSNGDGYDENGTVGDEFGYGNNSNGTEISIP